MVWDYYSPIDIEENKRLVIYRMQRIINPKDYDKLKDI